MLLHLTSNSGRFLHSPPAKPLGKELSPTAHMQSHRVVPGPIAKSSCLRRTIWAGWDGGGLSPGHPPQSLASDSPKILLAWGAFAISGITHHREPGLPQLTASQIVLASETPLGSPPQNWLGIPDLSATHSSGHWG